MQPSRSKPHVAERSERNTSATLAHTITGIEGAVLEPWMREAIVESQGGHVRVWGSACNTIHRLAFPCLGLDHQMLDFRLLPNWILDPF